MMDEAREAARPNIGWVFTREMILWMAIGGFSVWFGDRLPEAAQPPSICTVEDLALLRDP